MEQSRISLESFTHTHTQSSHDDVCSEEKQNHWTKQARKKKNQNLVSFIYSLCYLVIWWTRLLVLLSCNDDDDDDDANNKDDVRSSCWWRKID